MITAPVATPPAQPARCGVRTGRGRPRVGIQARYYALPARMKQRRWLGLLKDYDIAVLYHPGKANMVADALSRKAESLGNIAYLSVAERPLALDAQALANQFVRLDVKYEHQRPGGLLQRLEIPGWKGEQITMDFVVGLPWTRRKFNAVWVIMDRLTKSTHFIPMVTTYSSDQLA
ncbi:uncharacterized protein [Nicotiana tomentosiformis]|uniref:uncharacterized protein n=1 Tax=Nicotiana tomentosiformis TaxID=4098 RepID=UPI00388C7246